MKLKFYLRGLGLGLIVAALVLGVHHARSAGSAGTMTDDEVKARAAQLGMIDGSSRLTDDELSTEEMLAELQDNDVTDVTNETADADIVSTDPVSSDQDVDSENAGDTGDTEETASDVIADAAALIEDTTAEITTDAPDDPGLDYPTEDDSFMMPAETITSESSEGTDNETDHEFTPAQEPSAGSATGGAGTITISSGDSSDRVARKLADAGIVSSAADYDKFLCTHGYDRVLRVGTYDLSAGMSDDEIARVITGR